MYWSQVRVLAGPPKSYYEFNKNYFILSHVKNARFEYTKYMWGYHLLLINSNEKYYIMRLSYLMIFIASTLTVIVFWASSNICRFNFAIEKKTDLLNIVTEEIDPSLGNAKVYYFQELNCNNVDLNWNIDRVIKNFHALNVVIYQELTTDIKGNPN